MKCTDKIHAASELNIISVLRCVLIVLRHRETSPAGRLLHIIVTVTCMFVDEIGNVFAGI